MLQLFFGLFVVRSVELHNAQTRIDQSDRHRVDFSFTVFDPLEDFRLFDLMFVHEVVRSILADQKRSVGIRRASRSYSRGQSHSLRTDKVRTHPRRPGPENRANEMKVSWLHYFARWKFLQKGFWTVRFVHLECIFTGNGQLCSAVLSSDLSFVSSDITRNRYRVSSEK